MVKTIHTGIEGLARNVKTWMREHKATYLVEASFDLVAAELQVFVVPLRHDGVVNVLVHELVADLVSVRPITNEEFQPRNLPLQHTLLIEMPDPPAYEVTAEDKTLQNLDAAIENGRSIYIYIERERCSERKRYIWI